jgi:hypothetical protein
MDKAISHLIPGKSNAFVAIINFAGTNATKQ